MCKYPLTMKNGHMFIELENGPWLMDTGAPTSFGSESSITIEKTDFEIQSHYMGMDISQIEDAVGVDMVGLLGTDVLDNFDILLDVPSNTATISNGEIKHSGTSLNLYEFMGIPIVTALIGESEFQMFLDTGAEISYLQDEILETFPKSGPVEDFYPGFGPFETETYYAKVTLGNEQFSLRTGTLPQLLGMTLMMGGIQGILGNDIFRDRRVGYFPRRELLVI